MSESRDDQDVLRLASVWRSYRKGQVGEVRVLAGVSLSVRRAEVVGLVAPSGAGKSTLLHIAGLLDSPDEGQVMINGSDLASASDRVRTHVRCHGVGFVYQFHHLLQEFSAVENVVLPQLAAGKGRKQADAWAMELLERTGLKRRARHRPSELSGGEQQRVAFCRALANRPDLLLADEPTGNLDSGSSESVFAVMMELVRESRLSALIATHDRDLAVRLDRSVSLDEGHLFELGRENRA